MKVTRCICVMAALAALAAVPSAKALGTMPPVAGIPSTADCLSARMPPAPSLPSLHRLPLMPHLLTPPEVPVPRTVPARAAAEPAAEEMEEPDQPDSPPELEEPAVTDGEADTTSPGDAPETVQPPEQPETQEPAPLSDTKPTEVDKSDTDKQETNPEGTDSTDTDTEEPNTGNTNTGNANAENTEPDTDSARTPETVEPIRVLPLLPGTGTETDMTRTLPPLPALPSPIVSPSWETVPADSGQAGGGESEPIEDDETPEPPAQPETVTLAVCGDVMCHKPMITAAWNEAEGVYDYHFMLDAARETVSSADYAVANLETTFGGGPSYSGYPQFNTPDALADALRDTGFDFLSTANNHCMDTGFSGLCRTLDVLDAAGIAHGGTSRTEEEEDTVFVADVGGITVAFVSLTYGTNGLPVSRTAPWSVNLFHSDYLTTDRTVDEAAILRELEQAKRTGADLTAVMMHWGVEYDTRENAEQERLTRFLFDNGADIVLGGHPHVLQPMELRELPDGRQGFVCYSLGNFISGQDYDLTDTTVILELTLRRNGDGRAEVADYVWRPMLMLDRETPTADRFELLDAYEELEHPRMEAAGEPWIAQKLLNAVDDCRWILDPDHDVNPSFSTILDNAG